jgi:hypothetical protein
MGVLFVSMSSLMASCFVAQKSHEQQMYWRNNKHHPPPLYLSTPRDGESDDDWEEMRIF